LDEWKEALSFRNYLGTNQFNELMTYPQGKPFWFWTNRVPTNFTVYAVTGDDPDDTVLLSTANWHGANTTNLSSTVLGNQSFIVMHKSGDGMLIMLRQLTNTVLIGSGGEHNYLPLK
jgi:hypothetical protein